MAEPRVGAIVRGDLTQCIICERFFASIHWHHTVPRSCGGHDELQIPLCGGCHTALHTKASAAFARVRGRRKKAIGRYWEDVESEQRAERWFKTLLSALLFPLVSDNDKTTLLPSVAVDNSRRFAMEIIKRDCGLTSMTQALLYCIDFTANSKGLYSNEQDSNTTSKKRNQLW